MNIIAVIPAHMASIRFPGKILFPFHGLPMIEHVRRRALLSSSLSQVYIATCDDEIANTITDFGGEVIRTANTHKNGTSRIAEAVSKIDCTHVILLQGDEPLLLPRHIDALAEAIMLDPSLDAWNATGPIESKDELDRHSFVKCAITVKNEILYCFRRSPSYSTFECQTKFIRKILGIIGYRKEFLLELTALAESRIEQLESIEQMRVIENGYFMKSVPVMPSLPSVNQPNETHEVLSYLKNNSEQAELLQKILPEIV